MKIKKNCPTAKDLQSYIEKALKKLSERFYIVPAEVKGLRKLIKRVAYESSRRGHQGEPSSEASGESREFRVEIQTGTDPYIKIQRQIL